MEVSKTQKILQDAKHQEFLAYGTVRIFEKRANILKFLRSWITFLGIVLPVTVGGVYASFGQSPDLMKLIVNISGSVGLVQLIISTWALVSGWDNKYESSIKSVQANTTIYNSWKRFCSAPPSTEEDIINKYDELYKITETQELIDMAQHIKDSEKKYAYVESMRYYSRACHDCKQIPNSENSKKCPSCGQKKVKQNERKSKEST